MFWNNDPLSKDRQQLSSMAPPLKGRTIKTEADIGEPSKKQANQKRLLKI